MTVLEKIIPIPKIEFNGEDSLRVIASPTSSKNDFDFYVGNWKLDNRRLKSRLDSCDEWVEFAATMKMYKILNGMGNIDHFYATFDGIAFEGMSIRFFNPDTRLWSIHWSDTNSLQLDKPTVGSFEEDFGHFFTVDIINEKRVLVVYRWDIRDKKRPIWSQAFSADKGENWEWNWYMYFSRADE